MARYPGQRCPICGELFEAYSTRRLYCSRACNLRAFRARRSNGVALLLRQSAAVRHGDFALAQELALRAERLFGGL